MRAKVVIRRIRVEDAAVIAGALQELGWPRHSHEYEEYARQDASGARTCFVAEVAQEFAGYCTLLRESEYPAFRDRGIPEVSDLNVLPRHRNRGIGSSLLDAAEAEAVDWSSQVGLGVGLYADYGAAQRLYVKRGYVPDGRGIMYANRAVDSGEAISIDDHALLMFVRTFSLSASIDSSG